jgi:cation diffusion facilitator family transporter
MDLPSPAPDAVWQTRRAMALSLAFGLLMLLAKTAAYLVTGSAAILSDASESVVHVIAVGFAAFSLRLSVRPADQRFHYGYERVSFFSAGFEGAMIILAGIYIIVVAARKWMAGLQLQNLGAGAILVAAAAVINAVLGWYLVRTGRRANSLILEANGKHILADSWTSFGVVGGLVLVLWTGWKPFDPLLAIAVALNILWSGGQLVARSVGGLMDYSDPATGDTLSEKLDAVCADLGVQYHAVRFRHTGYRLLVDLHLLFPFHTPLGEAHRIATAVEQRLPQALGVPAEVTTHLESLEDHSIIHQTNAAKPAGVACPSHPLG